MCGTPRVIVQNLCFSIENTSVNFNNIHLSLVANKCYGIIGDNGVGKSTLLKLLANVIKPHSGSITYMDEISYLPQDSIQHDDHTVAEVLGVDAILQAMDRIENGSVDIKDYDCVGDQWDIYQQLKQKLAYFECSDINLKDQFSLLSGGQRTKVLLTKILFSSADVVFLDEPSNHLDGTTRESLRRWVSETEKTIVIVSHNRDLLESVDIIFEMTSKNIVLYGGNYSFYLEEKSKHQLALCQKISDAKKTLAKARNSVQQSKEKHEQKSKKGKNLRRSGGIDKLSANSKKGRSEKTLSRNHVLSDRMLRDSKNMLQQVQSQLEIKREITACLSETKVANSKVVLNITDLCFGYNDHQLLLDRFNLSVVGAKRIAVVGDNGSGKTTLLQLILGQLKPRSGEITLGVDRVCYLDQSVSLLNQDQTILENYLTCNPNATEQDAYNSLASLNFRNFSSSKEVRCLSGGERIRAGIAIALLSQSPQLIVLDEPSNHLDIHSIISIEMMLNAYRGALIIVSHDVTFLGNINIDNAIKI